VRICHLGCGNSLLTEELYDAGYHSIVNVDNSDVVIQQMKERNAEPRPGMEWEVMDCTTTTFAAKSFDVAMDKALLDTFLCEDDAPDTMQKYFAEVDRIVKGDGLALFISFCPPEMVKKYFDKSSFVMTMKEVQAKSSKSATGKHFIYIGRTQGGGGKAGVDESPIELKQEEHDDDQGHSQHGHSHEHGSEEHGTCDCEHAHGESGDHGNGHAHSHTNGHNHGQGHGHD